MDTSDIAELLNIEIDRFSVDSREAVSNIVNRTYSSTGSDYLYDLTCSLSEVLNVSTIAILGIVSRKQGFLLVDVFCSNLARSEKNSVKIGDARWTEFFTSEPKYIQNPPDISTGDLFPDNSAPEVAVFIPLDCDNSTPDYYMVLGHEDLIENPAPVIETIGYFRKRVYQELKRYQEITMLKSGGHGLDKVFSNIHDGLAVIRNRKTVYVNDSFCEIFGRKQEEILGKCLLEFFDDEIQEEAESLHNDIKLSQTISHIMNFWLSRPDKTKRYIELKCRLVVQEQEMNTRYVMVSDRTEEKIAKESLERSGQRFKSIIASAPSLIQICDSNGHIEYVSLNAKRFTGYEPDELVGKFMTYAVEDEAAKVEEYFGWAFAQESGFTGYEYRGVGKDGRYWYISASCEALRDDKGKCYSYVMQFVDISKRKQAEKELHILNEHLIEQTSTVKEMALEAEMSKDELSLLLNNIDTHIWYLTDRDTYGAVNAVHADFIGIPKEKLEYKRLDEVMSAEEAEKWRSLNKRVFESREQVQFEKVLEDSNGKERLIRFKMTPRLETGRSGIMYVICTAEDITEIRKSENNRLQKEKLKGALEMSGAACHELNQPLQVIAGYLELIRSKAPESLSKYFDTLQLQTRKMGDITRKLQGITRYRTKDYLDKKIIDIDEASVPFDEET